MLNPFSGEFKGATGDHIVGIFSNSSVNMIICTFFFSYYFFRKKRIHFIIAGIVAVLTTFMSGILLAVAAFVITLFFNSAIKLKYKLTGSLFLVIAYFSFLLISPENVNYTTNNIKSVLSRNPPRKFTSFKQTYSYATSNVINFMIGAGPGNFSSRAAFVFGGEYVSWLPITMVYRSEAFEHNHFQLWNKEILSHPYQDGTANQPFSIYNQLLGEYGIVGLLVFIFLYIGYYLKKYSSFTYGRYLLVFILLIALMDYWFEYISIMILFEVLMFLQIKEIDEKIK
ncbi:MAG: hypothetical protein ACM3H8_01855 [Sphingobacteriales bacterium]